jgi:tryptophan 2,3-dioxygenase
MTDRRVRTSETPGMLTEAERRAQAEATSGEPILDFKGERSPYVAYGNVDVLLTLQDPPSGTHHEMVLIISGQVMELLFKLMTHELLEEQRHLRADDTSGAILTLQRVACIQGVLVKTWDVPATLTPTQFVEFRDHLGAASGFQSPGYRRLEFLLGNKDPTMMEPHRGAPETYAELRRAFTEPSVYDDVLLLLDRRGHEVAPAHLGRDPGKPYQPHPSVEDAWLAVYCDPHPTNDLFSLAEALMTVADLYKQWRYRHLVTVERVIGYKPGTGGTSGVEWLRRVSQHEFFPELWTVRTRL